MEMVVIIALRMKPLYNEINISKVYFEDRITKKLIASIKDEHGRITSNHIIAVNKRI